jgi:pyruvate,water dikinase
LRRRVRGALAYRESVRLRRARVFGIARRLFLAMGQGLVDVGLIDERRDVFYLRLDELRGAFEGTIAHGELRPLVALRRESARQATLLKAPGRFETVGIPYSPDNLRRAGFQAVSDRVAPGGPLAVGDTLVGLGASPGVGEGVASVVSDPKQAGRGVLVTYRTDPSWATVLPNVKALVVERGSPLTHVAIVARELRIPTVVQVEGVTEAIASGMSIRVDGGAGSVMRTM